MALGRLTSFTFGNSFLTLVYANSQTYYVSYAHIIAGESDSRSGDLTIWIYTAGEVGETLSVKNSDLVAIGSSATAFLALFNQNIQPYSYWQDFLDSTTASGALPSEPSALRGQCLYARFRPIYNFGSASLINVPARFKAGTLYSQVPDTGAGDFTVTRATTPVGGRSTRINKDGLIEQVADNVPRLDYPLGGAVNGCPALLVEPSGQNLLQRSEEFNDAYWSKSFGTVTQDQTTAPNGLTTADKYVVNNGQAANSPIIRSFTFATNTTYTLSLFVKKADYNTASIRLSTTETGLIANFFNLASGTATNNQIQNYGNGWYRVWVSFTTAATVTNGQVQLIRDAEVRDGVAGIFIWGAQLEVGSVPTSYIPTTTAAVTRGADVISRTSASALIGQSEGTIYAEVDVRSFVSSAARRIVNLRVDGSNLLSLEMNTAGNQFDFVAISGGVSVTASASGITTGVYKIAVGYNSATNGTALYVNGTLRDTKTIAIPNLSAVVFGLGVRADGAAGTQLNDRIRADAIYPTRLTNAQLATLTAL